MATIRCKKCNADLYFQKDYSLSVKPWICTNCGCSNPNTEEEKHPFNPGNTSDTIVQPELLLYEVPCEYCRCNLVGQHNFDKIVYLKKDRVPWMCNNCGKMNIIFMDQLKHISDMNREKLRQKELERQRQEEEARRRREEENRLKEEQIVYDEFCGNCGSKLEKKGLFCMYCGHKFGTSYKQDKSSTGKIFNINNFGTNRQYSQSTANSVYNGPASNQTVQNRTYDSSGNSINTGNYFTGNVNYTGSYPTGNANNTGNFSTGNVYNTLNTTPGYDSEYHSGRPINKWVAFFLCLYLGLFGVHRFYEGDTQGGTLYLCTFGLFGIGWMFDILRIFMQPNPYYI